MIATEIAIKKVAKYAVYTAVTVVFAIISGCATGPNANPRDPLEPFNRAMFSFNEGVDKVVTRPVAEVYVAVTPKLLRSGVTNFFQNLGELWTGVNSGLQLKGEKAVTSFMRFGVNTVFGLGGVLDVASEAGMQRYSEDFGQTLGRWGMPSGPYLVLPLWGPSTVRDAASIPVDAQGNPVSAISPEADRNATTVLNLVNTRARLFDAERLFNQIAIDKYSFARDAFMQKRRNDVYDGDPPDQIDKDTGSDPDPAKDAPSGENPAQPSPAVPAK